MEGTRAIQFANILKQRWPDPHDADELYEHAQDVEALTMHPGWVFVQELVGDLYHRIFLDLQRQLKPLEQAEYARTLGSLNGLQSSADAVATVEAVAREFRVERERAAGLVAGRS